MAARRMKTASAQSTMPSPVFIFVSMKMDEVVFVTLPVLVTAWLPNIRRWTNDEVVLPLK